MLRDNLKVKRWTRFVSVAVLCCLLALNAAACTQPAQNSSGDEKIPSESSQSGVNPLENDGKTLYWSLNPIEYQWKEPIVTKSAVIAGAHGAGNLVERRYQPFEFSEALKDAAVEDRINETINKTLEKMTKSDVPLYRGGHIVANSGYEISDDSVHNQWYGNFNNILSVQLYRYYNYENEDSEKSTYNVSMIETLNFDLTTGNTFALKDVFADGVDYLGLLNDYIVHYLEKQGSAEEFYYRGNAFSEAAYDRNLRIVSPFKGISENQKFSVEQNSLVLYFDYETPWVDTANFQYKSLIIPWLELGEANIGLDTRFFDETKDSIFIAEGPMKRVLPTKYYTTGFYSDHLEMGGYDFWYAGLLPELYPDFVVDFLADAYKNDESLLPKLDEMARSIEQEYNTKLDTSKPISAERYISIRQTGPYLNISISMNVNQWRDNNQGSLNATIEDFYCFDARTGKQIALEDVFAEGYDYNKLIPDAPDLTRFTMDTEYIIYRPKDVYFEYNDNMIPFEKIGYENLKVFQ